MDLTRISLGIMFSSGCEFSQELRIRWEDRERGRKKGKRRRWATRGLCLREMGTSVVWQRRRHLLKGCRKGKTVARIYKYEIVF